MQTSVDENPGKTMKNKTWNYKQSLVILFVSIHSGFKA